MHKKYPENTDPYTQYTKNRQKYTINTPKIQNMNTKGAGAEGARPLCGAAEGRPSCFCIFGVLIVDLFVYFWSTPPSLQKETPHVVGGSPLFLKIKKRGPSERVSPCFLGTQPR